MRIDEYSLAFSVSNLGPKTFQKLINEFGSSKKAWEGERSKYYELSIKDKTFRDFDLFRNNFDIKEYIKKLDRENVRFVSFFDPEYPAGFKKLENPPIGIFSRGDINVLKDNLKIAVVGTRKITNYGKAVTESIVSELTQNGVCIVSGLALGVDGTAHRTCLENRGLTVAVMPCGVDCCLPSENFSVYLNILKNNGLVISEYPLSLPPNKGTFLARNRLIAALSDGVLVTEAAEDSGSLVTAEWGFRLSKKVFAVPGAINSQMAKGSLKLLKQGAVLATCGQDVLQEFEQNKKLKLKKKREIFKNLSKEEKKVISLLENEELSIDEISKKTKIPISKLFVFISNLELKKVIKNDRGKFSII